MKKWRPGILLSVLAIIICLSVSAAALAGGQSDETSDTATELTFAEMFPDDNFRAYVTGTVLEDSTDAKGDHDQPTTAQMSIIESCTELSIRSKSISSLKGISYFSALTRLDCYYNKLTELDVSQNTALEYLNCSYNQLTKLDVSQNTALTELDCYSNQLTKLDVSQNTALTELHCRSNPLTELDVSQNTALEYLYCNSNQLTKLDVSQNTALEVLACYSNQLTKLDVSQNTALEYLYCDSNQLTELDVSQNTTLMDLGCDYNQLTELDVSQNTALMNLGCDSNQLTELDVSQNAALEVLSCDSNQLTELDVSQNTALVELSCCSNQLTKLDVSRNTVLCVLDCASNQLTELDLSNNSNLGSDPMVVLSGSILNSNVFIEASGTGYKLALTELDLSNNSELYSDYTNVSPQSIINNDTFVEASGSGYKLALTELAPGIDLSRVTMNDGGTLVVSTGIVTYKEKPETVSYLYQTNSPNDDTMEVNWTPVFAPEGPRLTFAEMFPDDNFRAYVTGTVLKNSTDAKGDNDQPTAAQMGIIESCTKLNIRSKSISSLKGISYFSALEYLDCCSNKLTELDVSQNSALEYLYCWPNQLTELDVSQNTALEYLYCSYNQLTKLDVSQNTALTELDCDSNQLTELDVSQNFALTGLWCDSNWLAELDLSNNSNLSYEYTSVSPQSIINNNVFIEASGSSYKLALTKLVSGIDLSRVAMNDGGTLDVSTGIVTYTEKPETVSYLYQTNSPNGDTMEVNWTPVFAESSVLAGDLDGDGVLSSADVVMLAKYLVGAVTLTDDQIAAADLNGDGAVTAADTVLLAKKLLAGN